MEIVNQVLSIIDLGERSMFVLAVVQSRLIGKKLEVTMVNGSTAEIDATDGVKIAGANVIQADIETSNGVIHVIDAVILP